MKKLALALVCLVSLAFFASCNPEGQPSIAVLQEEGYVANGDVVDVNTEFNFGFVMTSSIMTGKELATLTLTIDDGKPETITITGTEYTYRGTLTYELNRDEIIGQSTITATVADVDGETATATIVLSINQPDQPLEPVEFTWNRHGGNAATGLEEFGLEWKSNAKEIYAVITPMEGAVLYKFDPEVWETTTTTTEKAALFGEAAISVAQFKEVSCTAVDKDYDIVIGTAYNGEYHLIHVTHSHVFTFKGTDVTITGETK